MKSLLAAGFAPNLIEMRDGERNKKLATVEQLAEKLMRLGADREDALLVAFGGGVVGDVAAYFWHRFICAASTSCKFLPRCKRSWTLLSVERRASTCAPARNLLGTFHQPRAVLIDPAVLSTFARARSSAPGLYEALKCGVIGKPALFERLEKVQLKGLCAREIPRRCGESVIARMWYG